MSAAGPAATGALSPLTLSVIWGALRSICRALGRPDLERDPRFSSNVDRVASKAVLVPTLEAAFRARTVAEWLEALRGEGVPAAPSTRSTR